MVLLLRRLMPVPAPPAKRNCEGGNHNTPIKRPRVLATKIMNKENAVAGQDMFRAALLGGIGRDLSKVLVIIKPQHRVYIVN